MTGALMEGEGRVRFAQCTLAIGLGSRLHQWHDVDRGRHLATPPLMRERICGSSSSLPPFPSDRFGREPAGVARGSRVEGSSRVRT